MLIRLSELDETIALAHYDFGYGVKDKDVAEAAKLSPLIRAVMAPKGLIVSQQPMVGFEQVQGPESVDPERYLFYRAG